MHGNDEEQITRKLNAALGTYDPDRVLKQAREKSKTLHLAYLGAVFFIGVSCLGAGYAIGSSQKETPSVDPAGLDWLIDQVSENNGTLHDIAEKEVRRRLGL